MILITFLSRASTGIFLKEVVSFKDHITTANLSCQPTNFCNVLATILLNLSVNNVHVRYLVVSRLLPLVGKCAIYRGS